MAMWTKDIHSGGVPRVYFSKTWSENTGLQYTMHTIRR